MLAIVDVICPVNTGAATGAQNAVVNRLARKGSLLSMGGGPSEQVPEWLPWVSDVSSSGSQAVVPAVQIAAD